MQQPKAVKVSWETWPRHEIFQFFSGMSNPFFGVTFTTDVTKVKAYTKERGLSFYYALVWLCTRAFDQVEAFHYTMRNGDLYRLETRWPSFTDLKPGSEQFHIVTMPADGTIDEFCRTAKAQSMAQDVFIRMDMEGDGLFFCSCLPWLPLTALTNERDFNADDAIPRLAWGKYTEQDGRYTLGISVEANHRFIDGLHIGQFYQALCELIDNLT